jgi:hypothetical protein
MEEPKSSVLPLHHRVERRKANHGKAFQPQVLGNFATKVKPWCAVQSISGPNIRRTIRAKNDKSLLAIRARPATGPVTSFDAPTADFEGDLGIERMRSPHTRLDRNSRRPDLATRTRRSRQRLDRRQCSSEQILNSAGAPSSGASMPTRILVRVSHAISGWRTSYVSPLDTTRRNGLNGF